MKIEGTHWKTLWDEYAEMERRAFDAMPVVELLNRVKNGNYGAYYTLWYSIAEKATLEQAGKTLLDVLHQNTRYLLRYHCAHALLKLMGEKDIQPVDLSADQPDQDDLLKRIEKKLKVLLSDR